MKVIVCKHISGVLTCNERKRRPTNGYSSICSHGLEFIHAKGVSFGEGERYDADQRCGDENRSFLVASLVCYFEREAVEEGRDHTEEDE